MANKYNKKILIIEDEPSVLEIYARELEHAGFEVVKALDSDSGYDLAKSENPDLILLDIMIPGSGGLDLLRRFKTESTTKGILVAMLTNLDSISMVNDCYELGADAYFVKAEFLPSEITKEVITMLGLN